MLQRWHRLRRRPRWPWRWLLKKENLLLSFEVLVQVVVAMVEGAAEKAAQTRELVQVKEAGRAAAEVEQLGVGEEEQQEEAKVEEKVEAEEEKAAIGEEQPEVVRVGDQEKEQGVAEGEREVVEREKPAASKMERQVAECPGTASYELR